MGKFEKQYERRANRKKGFRFGRMCECGGKTSTRREPTKHVHVYTLMCIRCGMLAGWLTLARDNQKVMVK